MRWRVASALVVLLAGCGGGSPMSAREVVRKWAQALRTGDVAAACRLTDSDGQPCRMLLDTLTDPELRLVRTLGGRERPAYAFEGRKRVESLVVTAVQTGGGYKVHVEVLNTTPGLKTPAPCIVGVNVPDATAIEKAAIDEAREQCATGHLAPGGRAPAPTSGGTPAERGRDIVGAAGCLACHKIGTAGNDGPGPPLGDISSRLPPAAIRRALENPTAPMPAYRGFTDREMAALLAYLEQLRG